MTYAARKSLIRAVYSVARTLGLFRVARHLTRDGMRILCYHGFTLADEDRFVPGLFIDPGEFERRLRYLASRKFPVLSLQEAMERRKDGTLPDCATVITLDDGFYSVRRHGAEILQRFGFPSTLYMTTYFFERQIPFLNLAIDYIAWKSRRTRADLSLIPLPETQALGEVELTDELRRALTTYLTTAVKSQDDRSEQCRIVEAFGTALGVDYRALADSRLLGTATGDELREMVAMGMDVQLHTHRHFFPADPEIAAEEIAANRSALAGMTEGDLIHFAYPRGEWSPEHWSLLRAAGIETATTCDTGLIYCDTPALALPRIVDSARVSRIEFEAEMSGFTELVRRLRGRKRSRLPAISQQNADAARRADRVNASSSRRRC